MSKLDNSENERLKRENKILREAIEFYADTNNWKSGFSLKIDDTKMTETKYLRRGGKRARQALKEIASEGMDEK